ncbi:hypothetical protein [Psychromarinibacter halotolerans]|uniref:Lipocalin-like domain-containing protein n=1 Tax=Psychromarinibacter halotolerans TaxID=1775175 RepID=A0ABV7GVG9_9RHOB|nr:hypothetical protein [Psychromarinibacter halotolerans]MDF0594863.1 hypothetical protein [Psychromarinibacter halotolerans]
MKTFRRFVPGAIALPLLAADPAAAQDRFDMAGTWEIVALSEGDAFDHCEARREVDGTEVRMILQDESWTVWASVSGAATDAVSLDIDDTVYAVEAQVTSDGTRLGLTRDGMEAVRNGTLATLGVGDTVAEIALNGTAAAALRVEDCTFNEGQPPEPVDLHTPAPVAEPAPGPGCPAGSSVASADDGGETELSLTYDGPETPLQLYWVDPYGRLLPMPALLNPKAQVVVPAYKGQSFLVKALDGSCLGDALLAGDQTVHVIR